MIANGSKPTIYIRGTTCCAVVAYVYVRGVCKDLWVLSRRGEDKGLLYER